MIGIVIKNLQAIANASITVHDNSIVEFIGDNSNGKSILAKTLQYVLSGDIRDKDTRRALIKDGEVYGSLTIVWDKKVIGFVIAEELSASGVIYQKDKNDPSTLIRRNLNEGGIDKLIHEFGFRVYAKGEICLQLHPTWGAIPFITTSGRVNEEIVTDITTDKIADNFMESFEKICFPAFKQKFAQVQGSLKERKKILENMTDYDWEAWGRLTTELREIADVISKYEYSNLKRPKIPPKIDFIDLPPAHLTRPSGIDCSPICGSLTRPTKSLHILAEINNGVCPTCKRPFFVNN